MNGQLQASVPFELQVICCSVLLWIPNPANTRRTSSLSQNSHSLRTTSRIEIVKSLHGTPLGLKGEPNTKTSSKTVSTNHIANFAISAEIVATEQFDLNRFQLHFAIQLSMLQASRCIY